jgi:hypothetical protein
VGPWPIRIALQKLMYRQYRRRHLVGSFWAKTPKDLSPESPVTREGSALGRVLWLRTTAETSI